MPRRLAAGLCVGLSGEGGVLTEAVRRHPYSVGAARRGRERRIPACRTCSTRCSTRGMLRDGEGRDIDFQEHADHPHGPTPATDVDAEDFAPIPTTPGPIRKGPGPTRWRPELLKTFKARVFSGVVTLVSVLSARRRDHQAASSSCSSTAFVKRVTQTYKATMEYSPEMVDVIAARCKEVESGATQTSSRSSPGTLLPELSARFPSRAMADGQPIRQRSAVGIDGKAGPSPTRSSRRKKGTATKRRRL